MILFYAALLAIGAIAALYLEWKFIFLLSCALVGAAYIAMVFVQAPHAGLHAGLGLVAMQLSYVVCGVAIEGVRDARQSRAEAALAERKNQQRERNYRKVPLRLRRWQGW